MSNIIVQKVSEKELSIRYKLFMNDIVRSFTIARLRDTK